MHLKLAMRICLILALAGTTGCSWISNTGFQPESAFGGAERVNLAGANQLFEGGLEGTFKVGELAEMVRVSALSYKPTDTTNYPFTARLDDNTCIQPATQNPLDKALSCVDALRPATVARATAEDPRRLVRSAVVGRIMLASDQRCNLWFTYVTNLDTYNRGLFGTLSTVFGGVGAAVGSEAAARVLAGLAGVSSGVGAELQAAMFKQATLSVVVPAVQIARTTLRATIDANLAKPYDEYGLLRALDDVVRYHGSCTITTGLQEAQAAVAGTAGLAQLTTVGTATRLARGTLANGGRAPLVEADLKEKAQYSLVTGDVVYILRLDPAPAPVAGAAAAPTPEKLVVFKVQHGANDWLQEQKLSVSQFLKLAVVQVASPPPS